MRNPVQPRIGAGIGGDGSGGPASFLCASYHYTELHRNATQPLEEEAVTSQSSKPRSGE